MDGLVKLSRDEQDRGCCMSDFLILIRKNLLHCSIRFCAFSAGILQGLLCQAVMHTFMDWLAHLTCRSPVQHAC